MSVATDRLKTMGGVSAPPRNRFFMAMSIALAATVFAGFAPTYYLKSIFGSKPLSPYLHVHGVVLSAWYILFVVQTCLVVVRRVDVHRQLGVAGAIVAGVLPIVTMMVDRATLFLTVPFVCLVGAAVYCRRQREVHKRLMMIASIAIVTPATGRLAGHALSAGVLSVAEWPLLTIGLQVAFLIALASHDLVSHKRVHPVTLVGVLPILLGIPNVFQLARQN